tara:strand:+ start:129 stop:386 length:258 start_codon:yes stop_codon:yes gene_type:complete
MPSADLVITQLVGQVDEFEVESPAVEFGATVLESDLPEAGGAIAIAKMAISDDTQRNLVLYAVKPGIEDSQIAEAIQAALRILDA